ncbi:hypothetical protein LCGC14_2242530 [marine sediment metagenome]|uniref:SprT-like domain-containing protein n=1 Tax=marine sediment metagenome TaxID=412755 RepID=A0A0F9FHI6_9ZZZZ
MKLTTTQKWRRTLAWLRRNFPPSSKVSVRSLEIKEHGCTTFGYAPMVGSFEIQINRKKSFSLRIDTLLHEWAHCVTWLGAETDIEDHSAEWGVAYAKIYRTFLEWNYGREGSLED